VIKLLKLVATEFPQDVIQVFIDVFRNMIDLIAKNQLKNLLENIPLAKLKNISV